MISIRPVLKKTAFFLITHIKQGVSIQRWLNLFLEIFSKFGTNGKVNIRYLQKLTGSYQRGEFIEADLMNLRYKPPVIRIFCDWRLVLLAHDRKAALCHRERKLLTKWQLRAFRQYSWHKSKPTLKLLYVYKDPWFRWYHHCLNSQQSGV
ncbi:unnamed protein product [Ranitomeya imitator]|uniref:Uncharacterized protein n=1 Tax=Ranitomeya imitator TaxID=111125 RepID=A0ABN9MD74_9NEOB|nr:unnamed protein product [Ranitomeya imitator]